MGHVLLTHASANRGFDGSHHLVIVNDAQCGCARIPSGSCSQFFGAVYLSVELPDHRIILQPSGYILQ